MEKVIAKILGSITALFLEGALFFWLQGLAQPVVHFSHISYWQALGFVFVSRLFVGRGR